VPALPPLFRLSAASRRHIPRVSNRQCTAADGSVRHPPPVKRVSSLAHGLPNVLFHIDLNWCNPKRLLDARVPLCAGRLRIAFCCLTAMNRFASLVPGNSSESPRALRPLHRSRHSMSEITPASVHSKPLQSFLSAKHLTTAYPCAPARAQKGEYRWLRLRSQDRPSRPQRLLRVHLLLLCAPAARRGFRPTGNRTRN